MIPTAAPVSVPESGRCFGHQKVKPDCRASPLDAQKGGHFPAHDRGPPAKAYCGQFVDLVVRSLGACLLCFGAGCMDGFC